MVWTDADVAAAKQRMFGDARPAAAIIFPVPRATPGPMDRYASKLERRYAETVLAVLKYDHKIHDWWYEGIKLRLAENCFYTPDFLIQYTDGELQFHETKGGFWREDARVKIKVAATMYPCFSFRAVQWVKGVWRYEDF
jgi:hypothetical protein